MKLLVAMRADISSGKNFFEMSKELWVDRHHIFEVTVRRAILDHQDLAVAFKNGGLNLPDSLVQQHAQVLLSINNLLPRFAHTVWTKRICLPRPTERRLVFSHDFKSGLSDQ